MEKTRIIEDREIPVPITFDERGRIRYTPLPVPPELSPFDPRDRILWAFNRGITSRFSESDLKEYTENFIKTYGILDIGLSTDLETIKARVKFSAGFLNGAVDGAKEAIRDFVGNVKKVLNSMIKFYSIVYNPQLVSKTIGVYFTAPGTDERKKALGDISEYFSKTYPDVAEALLLLAMIEPAFKVLEEWISQQNAVAQFLVAISEGIGELVGEELKDILSLSNKPEEQGEEVGKIIGGLVIEVAKGVLDLVDILALLVSSLEPGGRKNLLEGEEPLFIEEEGEAVSP